MKCVLLASITQTFKEDPLLWLWLFLGVVGLVLLGICISWFWGKPVVIFYIDKEVKSIIPFSRGEKFVIPIELTEYKWFLDKDCKIPLPSDVVVKKRVNRFYTKSKI